MAARIPSTFMTYMVDNGHFVVPLAEEERAVRDDEVESTGNESMKVHMNTTASDVLSLDDNNSVSQIDPGNFSESDIEEDTGSNCCLSFTDVLGEFPESDIEESEDMPECLSDAGVSFNSDVGSPVHSSCRSYPVSEDRDDREDYTTPMPAPMEGNVNMEMKTPASVDYDYESELSGSILCKDGGSYGNYPRRLRTLGGKRRSSKASSRSSHHKKSPKAYKTSEKSFKRTTCLGGSGKRKALAVMTSVRLADDMAVLPAVSGSSVPKPPPRSLNIPLLELCITEDEGYLGMAEETSEDSEREKDENKVPKF